MSDLRRHDDALTRALRALAENDKGLSASPQIEPRLLTEAHAIAARLHRRRAYTAVGGLAAALLAAIAVSAWRAATVRLPAVDSAGPREVSTRPAPDEVATEFFPLMYSNVPVTNGHTVRLELPRAALALFGLEAGDASGTVLADVVVGQDGLARAVRFMRPAASVKEQRQ